MFPKRAISGVLYRNVVAEPGLSPPLLDKLHHSLTHSHRMCRTYCNDSVDVFGARKTAVRVEWRRKCVARLDGFAEMGAKQDGTQER